MRARCSATPARSSPAPCRSCASSRAVSTPRCSTDRGLRAAVDALAARSPLPVELDEIPDERLPGPVEAAAYYLVAEALTNVAKYAEASLVRVRITTGDGDVVVEVSDDGVGGADPAGGSGLRGLADRVEALGGTLAIDSAAGAGTMLRAEIPGRTPGSESSGT